MKFDFDSTDVCVYHLNCHDGFCCAYFVWSRMDRQGKKGIEYLALSPSTKITQEHLEQFQDKNVLVVDLSFSREDLQQIRMVTKNLLVVDHHKTAKEDLEDLDFAIFDMDYSGCGLLQKLYLEQLQEKNPLRDFRMTPTALVAYTQDRDIWTWKLPDSKAVNAYLQTVPFDFATWHDLEWRMELEKGLDEIKTLGAVILETQQRLCDELAGYASLVDLHVDPEAEGTVRARVVNCPVRELISMTGHTILENEQEKPIEERVDIAIMYTIFPDGGILFSVRSAPDYDASVIAKAWGGGGHKNACGFKSRIEEGLPWTVVD